LSFDISSVEPFGSFKAQGFVLVSWLHCKHKRSSEQYHKDDGPQGRLHFGCYFFKILCAT
jgi:hypothetical protein